jgi:hypothetical protein
MTWKLFNDTIDAAKERSRVSIASMPEIGMLALDANKEMRGSIEEIGLSFWTIGR